MDIFELLKNNVGCEYISDLRNEPYLYKACHLLTEIPLDGHSFRELCDLAEYLYGEESFESREAVICFLKAEKVTL